MTTIANNFFIHVGNVPRVCTRNGVEELTTAEHIEDTFNEFIGGSCHINCVSKVNDHNYIIDCVLKNDQLIDSVKTVIDDLDGCLFEAATDPFTAVIYENTSLPVLMEIIGFDTTPENTDKPDASVSTRNETDAVMENILEIIQQWLALKNKPPLEDNEFILIRYGIPIGMYDDYDDCVTHASEYEPDNVIILRRVGNTMKLTTYNRGVPGEASGIPDSERVEDDASGDSSSESESESDSEDYTTDATENTDTDIQVIKHPSLCETYASELTLSLVAKTVFVYCVLMLAILTFFG